MKKLLFVYSGLLFSSISFAQNCEEPIFISDSIYEHVLQDSVTWFKLKAKGGKLQLAINWLSYHQDLSYQVFKDDDCSKISSGQVLPIRSLEKGKAVISEELWDFVEKQGSCVCQHCLSKVRISQKNTLNLEQEAFYLIKVNHQEGKLKLGFRWFDIDPRKKVFSMELRKEALEVGMVYQLKTVQFEASKTEFSNAIAAQKELDSLADFLVTNTKIKINVVGHVNGPVGHDSDGYQKLSDARAKKIKEYLVSKGIVSDRIFTEGKGNTMMIYPSPKQEWQAQENRRVEIVISAL